MRIHLVISRHGLPVTRILWTTTASSAAEYGIRNAASTSAIASARTPNSAFGNGGYTIAQLLEDVNEVVPLETEPRIFDNDRSGQWGLEDYVVEVGGIGVLALHGSRRNTSRGRRGRLPELRARRLCGRHQITADGKHLIDGVPFGKAFFSRSVSTRPAITIPPRKKRRTVLSGWDHEAGYGPEQSLADEQGDADWQPPSEHGFGKELSIIPPDHDMSMGTVIRHPVNYSADEDSEDDSDYEEGELESELKALKEDFEAPPSHIMEPLNQSQGLGTSLHSGLGAKRPASSLGPRRSSLAGASSSSKRSRGDDSSPRASKAVRFNNHKNDKITTNPNSNPSTNSQQPQQLPNTAEKQSISESSSSSSDSDSDSSSDSGSESSSSDESSAESAAESDEISSTDSSSDDSESTSSSSSSGSADTRQSLQMNKGSLTGVGNKPPGSGSIRTRKSNQRVKLRRRLSLLKQQGLIDENADFAALRAWEEENGGFPINKAANFRPTPRMDEMRDQEKAEFEAKREKLLRALATSEMDIEETSEKENVPPQPVTTAKDQAVVSDPSASEVASDAKVEADKASRRQLDIASSRRLLFGSLGVRNPKTKDEEEATRKKLTEKASVHSQLNKQERNPATEEPDPSLNEIDWQSKLDIRTTECVFTDVPMTAPPFPFVQRWDKTANDIIYARKGGRNKRKRKQRIQVYEQLEDEHYGESQAGAEHFHLDYDEEPDYHAIDGAGGSLEGASDENASEDDLPPLPRDLISLADLCESECKPGAIIAFKHLDVSKETKWEPRMSEYKVAEVLGEDDGRLNIRLAIRDRRPNTSEEEEKQGRSYGEHGVPGLDDEEDDGHRDFAFAELYEPKLLRVAPVITNDAANEAADAEGSNISIVQDSMQIPPGDMDLDDTTFATLATAVSYLEETPHSTHSRQRINREDDEESDSPAIPSPSFSGFHSAQSSPGTRIRIQVEDSNLDGHTLIGEAHSSVADNPHDLSALSFLSTSPGHENDGQAVDEPHLSGNVSGAASSISQVSRSPVIRPSSQGHASASSVPATDSSSRRQSAIYKPTSSQKGKRKAHSDGLEEPQPRDSPSEIPAGEVSTDNADHEGVSNGLDDQDSVIHSGRQSTHVFSPRASSPEENNLSSSHRSSPRSSPHPPTSAQHELVSQSSNITGIQTESLPNSNPSKGPSHNPCPPEASQESQVIDLTNSPDREAKTLANEKSQNRASKVPGSSGKKSTRQSSSQQPQTPSGKTQHLAEVVVQNTPSSSQRKKRRLSRKF
ncbi:hypothetical protein N7468_006295 [Penicillium chermesinum]|uniref:Uncharacterized protein n=1 Tax=Penicillium chermesinum TaxID=63820 RepID=A0A9W9NS18_9EURO|nr:uncharacterized protein N7468_006295 [Penicillium chermesinum]KAJ5225070.1 hypothetical protein N7468_006295 [Penicillium chermesinum]